MLPDNSVKILTQARNELLELPRLMSCFSDSFIYNNELVLVRATNLYFILPNELSRRELAAKLLNWCSRDCCKSMPYPTELGNKRYWQRNLRAVNEYCGTNFDLDDMTIIYQKLGNEVRPELTYQFIDSGFDMSLLGG